MIHKIDRIIIIVILILTVGLIIKVSSSQRIKLKKYSEYSSVNKKIPSINNLGIIPKNNIGVIILDIECMSCYNILDNWNNFLIRNKEFSNNLYIIMLGKKNDYWKQFENYENRINIVHTEELKNLDTYLLANLRCLIIIDKAYKIKDIYSGDINDKMKYKILNKYLKNE